MCNHVYKTYSTSIDPASLLVQCEKCKEKGRVLNFYSSEWEQAKDRKPFAVDAERVESEKDYFGFNFRTEF